MTVKSENKTRKFVGRFVRRVENTLWFLSNGETKDTLHGMLVAEATIHTVSYNTYGEAIDGELITIN